MVRALPPTGCVNPSDYYHNKQCAHGTIPRGQGCRPCPRRTTSARSAESTTPFSASMMPGRLSPRFRTVPGPPPSPCPSGKGASDRGREPGRSWSTSATCVTFTRPRPSACTVSVPNSHRSWSRCSTICGPAASDTTTWTWPRSSANSPPPSRVSSKRRAGCPVPTGPAPLPGCPSNGAPRSGWFVTPPMKVSTTSATSRPSRAMYAPGPCPGASPAYGDAGPFADWAHLTLWFRRYYGLQAGSAQAITLST